MPRVLSYGGVAARRGIICDYRDDGLTIVIPPQDALSRWFRNRSPHWFWPKLSKWMHRAPVGQVIFELTADELTLIENDDGRPTRRSWPRREITELRPNRYSFGLLLRIPDKENIDLVPHFDDELIQWLGKTLGEAMFGQAQS